MMETTSKCSTKYIGSKSLGFGGQQQQVGEPVHPFCQRHFPEHKEISVARGTVPRIFLGMIFSIIMISGSSS